jgi:outer membrane protein assembly factor BamB
MFRHLLTCACVLLPVPLVHSEDWPEFRGPTGQGHVRKGGMPLEWGPEKNVVWRQDVPGAGWSSPIVVSGRVYLTTAVPIKRDSKADDQSLRTLCLDAKNGKTVWDVEVFLQEGAKAPRIHGKNGHASPTPLFHEGRLYVHFGHQGTACLDLDGKVLWRNRELTYEPVHGNGGSPIVVDDLLLFNCDGGDKALVVALERRSGKVKWKVERNSDPEKAFSFCTPLLIEVKGKKQVISPGSDVVAAYDPATGREIWRVRYVGYSVIPRPVFGHGLVFVCTGYNTPSLLAIRPDGTGDVTDSHVAWKARTAVPHTPSLLLVGDELYAVADKGMASCLDAKTGKVHWQQRLGGAYSASPVFAECRVYFQNEDGVGTVIKAGTRFERLARNVLGERTLASYAVADGSLFLRTERRLYRFEGGKKE